MRSMLDLSPWACTAYFSGSDAELKLLVAEPQLDKTTICSTFVLDAHSDDDALYPKAAIPGEATPCGSGNAALNSPRKSI